MQAEQSARWQKAHRTVSSHRLEFNKQEILTEEEGEAEGVIFGPQKIWAGGWTCGVALERTPGATMVAPGNSYLNFHLGRVRPRRSF